MNCPTIPTGGPLLLEERRWVEMEHLLEAHVPYGWTGVDTFVEGVCPRGKASYWIIKMRCLTIIAGRKKRVSRYLYFRGVTPLDAQKSAVAHLSGAFQGWGSF